MDDNINRKRMCSTHVLDGPYARVTWALTQGPSGSDQSGPACNRRWSPVACDACVTLTTKSGARHTYRVQRIAERHTEEPRRDRVPQRHSAALHPPPTGRQSDLASESTMSRLSGVHVRIGRLAGHVCGACEQSLTAGGENGEDDDDAAAEALARAAQISFEEEFRDGDWRIRRAQLLAGDDVRWVEQLARNKNAALKGTPTWVHPLDEPEPGAVLLADPKMGHFQQQYFAQCVILVLEHSEEGSIGVILNRPTPFSLDGGEQIPPAFRNCGTVNFGGDVRGNAIVHTAAEVSGAKELMPGVFYGGSLQEAGQQVESGQHTVEDFRFFVGVCGWGPGQLSAELARGGSWHCAACSPELLLAPRRHYQPALWREMLYLMGDTCESVHLLPASPALVGICLCRDLLNPVCAVADADMIATVLPTGF